MICRWLLVGLLLSSNGGRVLAQAAGAGDKAANEDRTAEAKGLFNAGRAAFDAGRYTDALDYFQRSYAISGRPGLLYNIGLAYDRMREDERALQAYEQYLQLAPDAENRVEVETRAAAIRNALARRQPAPPAAPTPAETAAAAPPAPASAAPSPATRDTAAREDRDPEGSGGLLSQWWFWTAVGVVAVGGVTAGVLAASGGGDDPEPLEPRSGVVVTTLRRAQ